MVHLTSPILAASAGDVGQYVLVVLIGVASGVLSALLGVGGAVVTTPAIRFLGATPIEAVGSTVPAILPGAISGSWRYAKAGLVEWRTALCMGASGAVLAVAGAVASDYVDGRVLMVLTAVLMLWSGWSVVRGGRAGPKPSTASTPPSLSRDAVSTNAAEIVLRAVPRHSLRTIAGLGAVAGFVAGFLGVGGGIVMVPVLTGPLRFPVRAATASSLVAVAIFSLPALITHTVLGHVNWYFATALMIGVVPGAQIG
ncbi:MAG: sulfite exporter TauE/SafE family protein, partial [Actinomycetes bacterium]